MRLWHHIKFFFSLLVVAIVAFPVVNKLTGYRTPEGLREQTFPVGSAEPDTVAVAAAPVDELAGLHFPVAGAGVEHIISYFGDPRGGGRRHEGVDIGAERGRPVVAALAGTVQRVKSGGNGGRQIWLRSHDGRFTLYYAHLDRQLVAEGAEVQAGQVIGAVGNTGNAAGATPHLHFCIYRGKRQAVDPLPYLTDLSRGVGP